MQLMRHVFPAPLGPMIDRICSFLILKSTAVSAFTPPKLRCMSCGSRFDRAEFDLQKLKNENQLPPRCRGCNGVLKYDGVYFREPIPTDVYHQSKEAAQKCDLMLICGTSGVVYPFAELPRMVKMRAFDSYPFGRGRPATIVEVNAEPTPLTHEQISDYIIQGRTGEILPKLVEQVKKAIGYGGNDTRASR